MLKAFVCIMTLAVVLAACRSGHVSPSTAGLQLVQDKNSMSASLIATMEFDRAGKTTISPTECVVKSIPISWTGKVFSGWAYEDAAKQTVMLVRGRVSDDGSWIETMKFSRKILDRTATGTEFEVAVRYIPIATDGPHSPISLGIFNRINDVRKHVESVRYELPGSEYVTTDWLGTVGFPPSLSIRFERAVFEAPITPGLGCPCEW